MAELSYRRHRFPSVVIQHAVWLYLRFTLSYRDVEELLAQQGLDLSYESVRCWVLKFGPMNARRLRQCRPCRAITGISTRWWSRIAGRKPAETRPYFRHRGIHTGQRSGLRCLAEARRRWLPSKAGRRGKELNLLPLPCAGSALPMSYAPSGNDRNFVAKPGLRTRLGRRCLIPE